MLNIKKVLTPLFIIFISGLCAAQDGFLLKPAGEGYQINFPSEPQNRKQTVPTEIGDLLMNIYIVENTPADNDKNLEYTINSSSYPDTLINSDFTEAVDEFFKNAINGAVTNVQGKLLTEEKLTLDGFPGRDVSVDYGNGQAVIRMRIYLVKNKFYMIQTVALTANDNNEAAKEFMDSFKLL